MITIDYHGFYKDTALADAEAVIGRVRMAGKQEQAEFITGFGVIREELFDLLEKYSLEPTYKMDNPGTILVTIE